MTPFFLFSTPRDRGSVLVRMLDASPGVRCSGEGHDFLARVRQMFFWREVIAHDHPEDFSASPPPGYHPRYRQHSTEESWNLALYEVFRGWCNPRASDEFFGFRDIFTLRQADWKQALDLWSWLQTSIPDAKLIFLTRNDEETEKSTFLTARDWLPAYAKCHGGLMRQVRALRGFMADYHEMNPRSTVLLDSSEIMDFDALAEKLGGIGLPLDRAAWSRELAHVAGDAKSRLAAAKMPEPLRGPFRLPIPEPVETPKTAVYTLRYGDADWIRECAPTLTDWCERHAYGLRVWESGNPAYPDEKFTTLDMMRDFLASDAERMIFVDADVFIHPSAPAMNLGQGFHAAHDEPMNMNHWARWLEKNAPEMDVSGWVYRNSGVWVCDRESARIFLAVVAESPSLAEGVREQHQFNAWWILAGQRGMSMGLMPLEWNLLAKYKLGPAWFFHLAGRKKMLFLRNAREAQLLPAKYDEPSISSAPGIPRAVVWPWLSAAAVWDELRYSMRSVDRHFADKDCPFFVFADKEPEWLAEEFPRAEFVLAESYEEALSAGVQCADEILWMNDDICMLRDMGWDDIPTLHMGDLLEGAGHLLVDGNVYRQGQGRTALVLHHHGAEAVTDYSTHTPYRWERKKAVEVLRKYGVHRKIPFETLYWNTFPDPSARPISDEKSKGHIAEDSMFLSYRDATLTDELKASIAARFPARGPALQVVWLALDGEAPHVEEFRSMNPDIPFVVADQARGGHKGWRAADERISRWWFENREACKARRVFFFEWDVRCPIRLDEAFLSAHPGDFYAAEVKRPGSRWQWFAETKQLPSGLQAHACGVAPLAVVMLSRAALDGIVDHADFSAAMGADVFGELRFSTLAAAAGFLPAASPYFADVNHDRCKNSGKTISHPVKP